MKNSLEAIEKALAENRRRHESEYDGVLGTLPEWIPKPLEEEFIVVRNSLLDKYNDVQICQWMKNRTAEFNRDGKFFKPYYPLDLADKLDTLNYIQELVMLGSEKGVEANIGKSGSVTRGIARTLIYKDAASKPRRDALSRVIIEIMKRDKTITFETLLIKLEACHDMKIIESVHDGGIEWTRKNGKCADTTLSALKKRFQRLKIEMSGR